MNAIKYHQIWGKTPTWATHDHKINTRNTYWDKSRIQMLAYLGKHILSKNCNAENNSEKKKVKPFVGGTLPKDLT